MVESRVPTVRNIEIGIGTRYGEKAVTDFREPCVQTGCSVANPVGVAGPWVDIEDTIGREFPRQQPDDIRENPKIFGSECGHLRPDIHAPWSVGTVSFRRADFSSLRIAFPNVRERPSRESRLFCMIDNKAIDHESRPVRSRLLTGDQIHHVAADESVGYGGPRTERTAGQLAMIPVGSVDGYSRCLGSSSGFVIRRPFGQVVGFLAGEPSGDHVVLFGGPGNDRSEVEKAAMMSETVNRGILARPSPESPRVAA